MWLFIIFLIIVGGLITLYTVEAWIDLDRWIADAPNREKNGYVEPVKIMTPEHPKVVETVKTLTPKLENFPKTTEDAKAKIDRLLKKSA
jgi:hypothetical protein